MGFSPYGCLRHCTEVTQESLNLTGTTIVSHILQIASPIRLKRRPNHNPTYATMSLQEKGLYREVKGRAEGQAQHKSNCTLTEKERPMTCKDKGGCDKELTFPGIF